MADKKNPKKPLNFYCKFCDFYSSNKKDYYRHLSTRKHQNADVLSNLADKKTPKNPLADIIYNCDCGRIYKHRQSLFKHKQNCNSNQSKIVINITNEDIFYKELFDKELFDKELFLNMMINNIYFL
jgi:hypothetical protein